MGKEIQDYLNNKKEIHDCLNNNDEKIGISKNNYMEKELYVCVNNYSVENIETIKKLANNFSVVNIVTENNCFFNLEKELDKQNIFITVSKNKRKALKKAEIVLNIDLNDFRKFNLNTNAKIISLKNNIYLPKSYSGKLVRRGDILNFVINNIIKNQ